MPARKGGTHTCSYCGLKGHQARTCHVALEGRQLDEHDRAAFRLLEGGRYRDLSDDRRRVAEYLRELASERT